MNSPEDNASTPPEPFLPGLAPVFDALAREAGPLLGLAPGCAALIGTTLALAIVGDAIRVDLPLRPRTRTNPLVLFNSEGETAALKLLRILMSPLEAHVTEILDAISIHKSTPRAMHRELTRSQEGLVKLEERAATLVGTLNANGTENGDKELAALAASLGLRYSVPATLRRHMASLRLFLRQMLIVSPLELADIAAWSDASLDGHVMELLMETNEVDRLLGLHPRHLDQLGKFRLDTCLSRGIEATRGMIGKYPRLATLWFADSSEVDALYNNPRLRQHRLADPFVVVALKGIPPEEVNSFAFFSLWRGFILTLFHLRLYGKQVKLTFEPEASAFLDSWLPDNLGEASWFGSKVAFPSLAMVAAINACCTFEDIETRSSVVVTLADAQVAASLLGSDLQATARRHTGTGLAASQPPVGRDLEGVLTKLSVKGPLTRRELLRSFHQISSEELDPLLKEGIERKLIEERGNRYSASRASRLP